MVAYVDRAMWAWQGLKWCHLLADDLDDLHRIRSVIGDQTDFVSGRTEVIGAAL
jgi:hypothetical protein